MPFTEAGRALVNHAAPITTTTLGQANDIEWSVRNGWNDEVDAIEAEAFAAGVAAVRAPDVMAEFVAFAVEYLVLAMPKGEDEPTVRAGRRILAALAAIDAIAPDSAQEAE